MSTLTLILLYTFLGSIGSLIGGFLLLSKEKMAHRVAHLAASFAAGTLLATAFFDLLPEAAHGADGLNIDVFFWTLVGIVLFFFLERFIHWFHHHEEYHDHELEREKKSTVPLIIIGDTMHNFLDGIVIAATFLTSIELGIITTLAVIAHEVPQEIGDFGLLLHKGLSKKKVVLVNIVSACAAFAGALIGYWFGTSIENSLPLFLSITAGFFIYIALSDLIPEIHHEKRKGFAFMETILFLVGIILIYLSVTFLHEG